MPHGQFQEYMKANDRVNNRIAWGAVGVVDVLLLFGVCVCTMALAGCSEVYYGITINWGQMPWF